MHVAMEGETLENADIFLLERLTGRGPGQFVRASQSTGDRVGVDDRHPAQDHAPTQEHAPAREAERARLSLLETAGGGLSDAGLLRLALAQPRPGRQGA